eukprot:UN29592
MGVTRITATGFNLRSSAVASNSPTGEQSWLKTCELPEGQEIGDKPVISEDQVMFVDALKDSKGEFVGQPGNWIKPTFNLNGAKDGMGRYCGWKKPQKGFIGGCGDGCLDFNQFSEAAAKCISLNDKYR